MSRTRAVVRMASVLALGVPCLATSCIVTRGIAVTPAESMPVDSALTQTVELTRRLGGFRGLHPYTDPYQSQNHFALCMAHDTYFLCVKPKDGEVQFRIYQSTPRFAPWADSLNHELMDSLRTMFGAAQVRDCGWRLERAPRESGCRRPR
jgi:hypothetical protein